MLGTPTLTVRASDGPPVGRLLYSPDEYSFHTEARTDGISSLVINTLQLELDAGGTVLYVWGYCPHTAWRPTTAIPPTAEPGVLVATGFEVLPGASVGLTEPDDWPVTVNARLGWVCVGQAETQENRVTVAFAPGAVAVLHESHLVAIWLRPEALP